jgi:hypothetical protein
MKIAALLAVLLLSGCAGMPRAYTDHIPAFNPPSDPYQRYLLESERRRIIYRAFHPVRRHRH